MSKRRKKISKRNARKWILSAVVITAVVFLGAVLGTVIGAILNIPSWSPETLYGSETTTLRQKR